MDQSIRSSVCEALKPRTFCLNPPTISSNNLDDIFVLQYYWFDIFEMTLKAKTFENQIICTQFKCWNVNVMNFHLILTPNTFEMQKRYSAELMLNSWTLNKILSWGSEIIAMRDNGFSRWKAFVGTRPF